MPSSAFDPTVAQSAVAAGGDGAPTADEEFKTSAPLTAASLGALAERYDILHEIARGGMGVVWRVRDRSFLRELAIKVLADEHTDKPELVRRFFEEAQISGQLQHPGVIPVHEVGALLDGRPFFTMKLVKGRTLAALLAKRAAASDKTPKTGTDLAASTDTDSAGDPPSNLPRLLKIFEQVCQTIAYAHSRNVIHRDLKPSNIMVGAFGEVQVMDWGLAKVVETSALAGGQAAELPREYGVSVIQTDRNDDSITHVGSILGTFAYMPPEQARGELGTLDRRADVFGLGAILAEILTGSPPYTGGHTEARARAQLGELTACWQRLESCGADIELVALSKHCLSPTPADRPKDAGEVAEAVTTHLHSVQERLREAELAEEAARTRAVEERKRKRVVLAWSLTTVLAVVLAAAGWIWVQSERDKERTKRNHDVRLAVRESTSLREQAQAMGPGRDNSLLWAQSREQAQRAAAILETGPVDPALRAEVQALLKEIAEEENEQRLWTDLESARSIMAEFNVEADSYSHDRAVAKYREAFASHRMLVGEGDATEAGHRLRALPEPLRSAAIAAVDEWIALGSDPKKKIDEPHLDWLRRLVSAADEDAWRQQVRAALVEKDAGRKRLALARLAAEADVDRQPVVAVLNLVRQLDDQGKNAATLLLRKAHQKHPEEFWVNLELGRRLLPRYMGLSLDRPGSADAARYLTAAIALRPENAVAHCNLAYALLDLKKHEEAAAACRRALALQPDFYQAYHSLGLALSMMEQDELAVAAYQEALKRKPKSASTHNNLGVSYGLLRRYEEQIACYRKALEVDPKAHLPRRNLAISLMRENRFDDSLSHLQIAIPLSPEPFEDYNVLGDLHRRKKDWEQAATAYRKAIELKPDHAPSYVDYGTVLMAQSRFEEAVTELSKAIGLQPDLAAAYEQLALALDKLNRKAEADLARRKLTVAQRRIPDTGLAPILDFRVLHGASSEALEAWIDDLPPGYRPTAITHQSGSRPPRFDAVAVYDGRRLPWLLTTHRGTPDEREAIWRAMVDQRLRHAVVCNFADGKSESSHNIWVRDGLAFYTATAARESFLQKVEDYRRAGFRPIGLSGASSEAGVPFYAGVFRFNEGLEWELHLDLSAEELTARIAEAQARRWRPDVLVSVGAPAGIKYLLVLVSNPNGLGWEFLTDLTPAALDEVIQDQKNLGRRPLMITSHGEGSQARSAGIWLDYRPADGIAVGSSEANPWMHLDKGVRLLESKKFEKAVAAFEKAIELQPDLEDAHQKLSEAYRLHGKHAEAMAAHRRYYKLKRGDVLPEALTATHFESIHGADEASLRQWLDNLSPELRPTFLAAQTGCRSPRFNAIAVRDGKPIVYRVGWHTHAADRLWEKMQHHDMRRLASGLYVKDDWEYSHEIWGRDGWTHHADNFSAAPTPQQLSNWRAQGMRPNYPHASLELVNGQRQFGNQLVPDESLRWEVYALLTPEQLAQKLGEAKALGWRPEVLVPDHGKEPNYALVLVSNPTDAGWEFKQNLTPVEFEKEMFAQKERKRRPLAIASHGDEQNLRYTAIWIDYLPNDKPVAPGALPRPGEKRTYFAGTQVYSLKFNGDGRELAVGGVTNPIASIRDLRNGREVAYFPDLGVTATSIVYSRDGKRILTGHAAGDPSAIVWSIAEERLLCKFPHPLSVHDAAFSPDDTKVATACEDGLARLWDIAANKLILTFKGHVGDVYRVSFSPDGKRLLTTSKDGSARIWNVETGQELHVMRVCKDWVVGRFLPDGQRAITGDKDGFVRFWNAGTGEKLAEWNTPSEVWHVDVAGDRVLTTHEPDKAVRLWDMQGKLLWEHQENGWIKRAVISPDGRLAAVGVATGFTVFGLPEPPPQSGQLAPRVDTAVKPQPRNHLFVATASSTRPGFDPQGALDGERFACAPASTWQGQPSQPSWWWQVTFPEPRDVGAILQVLGDHPLCLKHGPTSYVWQASLDGTTWRDLTSTAIASETRTFRLHRLLRVERVRHLRLHISAADGAPTLREVEFFATPDAEAKFPPWAVVVTTTGETKVPSHGVEFITLARSCPGWNTLQFQNVWLGPFDENFSSAEPRPLCAFLSGNFIDWCQQNREHWRGVEAVLKKRSLPLWASCGGAQGLAILEDTGVGKPWDCPHCRDPKHPKLPIYTHIGHTGPGVCGRYDNCIFERGLHNVLQLGNDPVFEGLPREFKVMQSHCGQVEYVPKGWVQIATKGSGGLTNMQCLRVKDHPIYAAQFHIEMEGAPASSRLLMSNFLKLADGWRASAR